MAWSKSTRIIILLVIDSLFFLLELVTGYAVHSLALVADSFHMLNDVLSLFVGLWAVRMASRTNAPKTYTYGYQRAETLGALVNGVFLVALCVTIFLDAIERFVTPVEVSNPKFVLVVGCLGLGSNLIGLVLFHDHSHGGHSHGGHSHGDHAHAHAHSHEEHIREAEEGRSHVHNHDHDHDDGRSESTPASYKLPRDRSKDPSRSRARDPRASHDHAHDHSKSTLGAIEERANGNGKAISFPPDTIEAPSSPSHTRSRSRKHSRSTSKGVPALEEFAGPTQFRNSIIAAGLRPMEDEEDEEVLEGEEPSNAPATQPLLNGQANGYGSINHHEHKHRQPREPGKGSGHSHGDLNMRGIFLHVMGDALGNLGVIASALIIWLSSWKHRFYVDPAISLVITVIILCSAIPLCKAAARILLQAVPHGIEVDDIRDDIEDLPGIDSIHHLHIWQLSDEKLIASLHVKVGVMPNKWTELAEAIRTCLHEYGIHSSTIQPEFEMEGAKCDNCCDSGGGCCPPGAQAEGADAGDEEDDEEEGVVTVTG